jgi:hypothetical protein
MKKRQKKLSLNRETICLLEAPRLRWAHGRGVVAQGMSGEDTCGLCDSNLSCSEVAEDCCVTTRGG